MNIQPIPTRWAGCHFRSRLEARWAVFFQTMKIDWEYEPEGFRVNGVPYLIDFRLRLPNWKNLWVEVKPNPSPDEVQKLVGFINSERDDGLSGATFLTQIPNPDDYPQNQDMGFDIYFPSEDEYEPHLDNYYQFTACSRCGVVGFTFCDRTDYLKCNCNPPGVGHAGHWANQDVKRVRAALTAARSERFGT